MNILGLGFTDHEASAVLVIDGVLTTGVARERLTRIKKDGKLWGSKRLDLSGPIRYCLESNGLSLGDLDLIAWSHIDHAPDEEVLARLASEGGIDLSALPRLVLPHHFAHASCAFYSSSCAAAAILVADGSGGPLHGIGRYCAGPEAQSIVQGRTLIQNLRPDESTAAREHESFYVCDGIRWQCLRKIVGDWGGIGAEYGSASEMLFGDCLHAGKTMGLAPYGQPHCHPLFLERGEWGGAATFRSIHTPERDAIEEKLRVWLSGAPPLDYEHLQPANYAASIQAETETALLAHAQWLRTTTGMTDLCVSGGVALNCVANSLLARESGFARVYVPAAPGDDGIAMGCALFAAAVNGELDREACRRSPAWGRSYPLPDPRTLELHGLRRCDDGGDVYHAVADFIAQGAVVGWFQAGAEMGPRALGYRSFLADPRNPGMRHHLNDRVKNREQFRPFAPVVIEEAALDYFEDLLPSYYMSFVARIRPERQAQLPAVTHVDGTARYQVLRAQDNQELYRLITAFVRVAGVPLLLNTSFNRAGEPLVETPDDAVRCFLASNADLLVIDKAMFKRTE